MMKHYDTIFLDRDGTLNPDPGYISQLKDFSFFDFALPSLKKLSEYRFCIVTNQSGISRGIIELDALENIHRFVRNSFKENGLDLLSIYVCTDHPDNATDRRKPNTGMFEEASEEQKINLRNSVMIGDSIADMEAAQSLGMDGILVRTGNGLATEAHYKQEDFPIAVVEDLNEAADWILARDLK